MEIPEHLTIEPIASHMVDDVLRLRRELFVEELTAAGVPQQNAESHVAEWGSPESLAKVTDTWGMIALQGEVCLRAVMEGDQPVGLFVGKLMSEGGVRSIDVVQLAPRIRGQGVGRVLIESFMKAGDPQRDAHLSVLSGNHRAQAFYDMLGFRDTTMRASMTFGGYETEAHILRRQGVRK